MHLLQYFKHTYLNISVGNHCFGENQTMNQNERKELYGVLNAIHDLDIIHSCVRCKYHEEQDQNIQKFCMHAYVYTQKIDLPVNHNFLGTICLHHTIPNDDAIPRKDCLGTICLYRTIPNDDAIPRKDWGEKNGL